MRAKRDQLATGVRFVQVQGDTAGTFSQVQYIQQPDPLSGSPGGSFIQSAGSGVVTLTNVDVTMGSTLPPAQYLVQPGDCLEVRDGGVYLIAGATSTLSTPPVTTIKLASITGYDASLNINNPPTTPPTTTTNYRILRQPRLLIGETPLDLPNNFAVDARPIPGSIIPGNTTVPWSNVAAGLSGNFEILFSPTGAVVGTNAGSGIIVISVYDMTMNPFDINRVGIVAVQGRTGFIGAYSAGPGVPGTNGYTPFGFTASGRESGL
jgi:hypothetical protein